MKILLMISTILILTSCKTEVRDSNAKYRSLADSGGNEDYQAARSVLVNRCFKCHEADGSHNYGSEDEESWKKNPEVSPGNPEGSILYNSIVSGSMPADGTSLSPDEKGAIYNWIKNMNSTGAEYQTPDVEDSSAAFVEAYGVIYQYCIPCHSASNSNNISSFEFPTQQGWAASGLIASGDASASLLFQRIQDGSMPPAPIAKDLPAGDIAKIQSWLNGYQFTNAGGGTTTGGGGGGGMTAAQRMTQAQGLLAGRCSGCHTGGGNAGGFNFGTLLDAGTTYADWDGAAVNGLQLFEPGNANGSRIFITLRNSGQQPADMPTNAGNAFNATEIGILRNWIIMANQP